MTQALRDLARELPERLGRPRRPRLDAARAAVAGCARSRLAALEALASRGVVPEGWVGDPARRFRTGPRWAEPLKSSHAVALAADPEGVLAAEALARDYVRRLRYYDAPALDPPAVLWTFRAPRLYARRRNTWGFFARRYAGLDARLRDMLWGSELPLDAVPLARRPRGADRSIYTRETSVLFADLRQYALLGVARSRGLGVTTTRVPERWWTLPAAEQQRQTRVEFRRFEELPDPFEPLLAIWRLGYALGPFDRDAIELVAPPADLTGAPGGEPAQATQMP